jgi:hypothetical protein
MKVAKYNGIFEKNEISNKISKIFEFRQTSKKSFQWGRYKSRSGLQNGKARAPLKMIAIKSYLGKIGF